MNRIAYKHAIFVLLTAGQIASFGVTIPGIFNTGVDNTGTVLASGADPHYDVVSTGADAQLVTSPPVPPWLANSASSKWIWNTAAGDAVGTFTFRISFDLSGLDPSTASIAGNWTSDNLGSDILVNGTSTGQTTGGAANFGSFHGFTVADNLLNGGVNTLDFVVNNSGGPGGFRAEFTSLTASEPIAGVPDMGSTAALAGLGFGALAFARRKSRV